MKYEVWLGNTGLYAVESVEKSAARKIAIYDSVGAGKFPQAESRGLREWEIKCELTERNDWHLYNWIAASDVFKDLASMMNKKTPARLVIRSNDGRTSERVLLKSFTQSQSDVGIYSVKISCVEYAEASVKTTDVPFVARPGKMPALPQTVTITEDNQGADIFDMASTILNGIAYPSPNAEDYLNLVTWVDPETLQAINPAALKPGDKVTPFVATTNADGERGYYDKSGGWHKDYQFGDITKGVVKWFGNYVGAFEQTVDETWNNPDWEGNRYMP